MKQPDRGPLASAGIDPIAPHAPSFASFWIAGFEGADHVNRDGVPLDLAHATGHLQQVRGDYRRARALGIRTVRESVGWRVCEAGGVIDPSRAVALAREAQRQDVEIVWTLWHYGIPDDVDPFDARVVDRFERFARSIARALAPLVAENAWFNLVNEISFSCWLLTEGRTGSAWTGADAAQARRLKENLVRASLRGARAVREAIPRARFLHIDPVIHAVAERAEAALEHEVRGQLASQYEAWDLALDPGFEAGIPVFERAHLIGINHYHSSQWQVPSRKPLRWHLRDPRRRRLADLCADVHARYGLPFMIAETSHFGAGRCDWLREVVAEIGVMRERGLPIRGACLYPFVDRPDWDRPDHWHRSGLYDVVPRAHERGPRRLPSRDYCSAFSAATRAADVAQSPAVASSASIDTLIMLSHLRWDSVWQRPQQLATRFAKRFRVLFVEEPCFEEGPPRAEIRSAGGGVTVLRPHTAIHASGFHDDQLPALGPMLRDALSALSIHRYAAYALTPMALPLLQDLAPEAIVYDCMDELAAFRFAPRQLPQRESALLRVANLVFTGGPSLYKAKLAQHDRVLCFPSSVDAPHFATARRGAYVHPAVAALPHPRLGFYGVIDERLDVGLVRELALQRPSWQFVLVGPVVKIDPATLPRAPNLHWLPQQPYEALPALIAGWDICMLPFARNEHTRFISPTKTLEYLAADKPVVSTPIADVVDLYGSVVHFGDEAESFVAACERLLNERADERADRIAATRALVERTSWDATAAAMADAIEAAARTGLRDEAKALLAGARVARRAAARPHDAECLVLGAGPTGLSAAYHYGAGATLLEREASVGGWCRSIVDRGFTFDCAGHIMFSRDAGVLKLYELLLGDNVVWQDREAWVYSKGVYTRYPFQGSLYGLPPDVLKECVVGAIEARFGTIDGQRAELAADCCADGADVAAVVDGACAPRESRAQRNFEEFIYATWGRGIARHFAIPYNRKLWTYPLDEIETSWLGGRVPLPDLEQIVEGALKPTPKPMGPNARFGYPREGGFQALMNGFLPHLRGPLELRADVAHVSPSKRIVTLADGRSYRYEALISTLPLPELVRRIGDEAPADVRAAAARLRRVSVRCVNFGIGREAISDKHWIYYPEDTVFHRVFMQGNASARNNAPGGFALTCEISYSDVKPLPGVGAALIERCRADLVRVGLIRSDDPVLTANEVDMPYAYVLYDHSREAAVRRIREWLALHNVLLAGRYSEWAYYNSDHAFVAGREAAALARGLVDAAGADARIA